MNDNNSYLISAHEVDVHPAAFAEIPTYEGHRWLEPDVLDLRDTMLQVMRCPEKAGNKGQVAAKEVNDRFGLEAGRLNIEDALSTAEEKFAQVSPQPIRPGQIRVAFEGELLAGHSFSKVNEELLKLAIQDEQFAVRVNRTFHNPVKEATNLQDRTLLSYVDRGSVELPHVTIRHCFPPNWHKPPHGKWIHIQPWEYGHLPSDWVAPLRDEVDEIWVPSTYVKTVYERSGVPGSKIHVIPWGVDTNIYNTTAVPLLFPTDKAFRFLFVGGAISRKGFDRVLEAYLSEFNLTEDVALIVKDAGGDSFYRYGNLREKLKAAVEDCGSAQVIHIDHELTERQMPQLYRACHCLVAPYRGEGFGLPVLEAMACGIPVIVPMGGATDDFVDDENGIRLEASEVESEHNWELAGSCLEIDVSVEKIRSAMRNAFENREALNKKGLLASNSVAWKFKWSDCWNAMKARLSIITACPRKDLASRSDLIAALVPMPTTDIELARSLSSITPFVSNVHVLSTESISPKSLAIAAEYGALTHANCPGRNLRGFLNDALGATSAKWLWVSSANGFLHRHPSAIKNLREFLLDKETGYWGISIQNDSQHEYFLYIENIPDQVSADHHTLMETFSFGVNRFEELQLSDFVIAKNALTDTNKSLHLLIEPWLEPWIPHGGRVFVDVGANVGAWTRWMADKFETIHAIEPNIDAIPELKKHLPKNVVVHEVGAWNVDDTLAFTEFEQSVHLSAYFKDEGIHTGPAKGLRTVRCLPIDSMGIAGPVDFIKCDTEGAEYESLLGAEATIMRDRPWLLIEIHSTDNFKRVTNLMESWNYLYTVIRDPLKEPFLPLWYAHCWLSCQAEGYRP
jgi:FkbM family methyltransferase